MGVRYSAGTIFIKLLGGYMFKIAGLRVGVLLLPAIAGVGVIDSSREALAQAQTTYTYVGLPASGSSRQSIALSGEL